MDIKAVTVTLRILFAINIIILGSCTTLSKDNIVIDRESKASPLINNRNLLMITLPNGDSISLPPMYKHERSRGDDSFVGLVTSESENFVMYYDIGGLAGQYVQRNDLGVVSERSINEYFIYVIELSGDSPVISATFPNRGSANFYMFIDGKDDPKIETMIQILKTYKARDGFHNLGK
ncbi:MAG: hypothetical protein QNJ55_03210 [Xenococcus sp. MO_188.B8]|nr:hypothetical protein [Xenococcus sp. MO_188.B8]